MVRIHPSPAYLERTRRLSCICSAPTLLLRRFAMQTVRKKVYDRLRMSRLYRDFKRRRRAVIKLLGGVCKVCGTKRNLHLHHKKYHKTESNYPRNTKSFWTRFRRVKEAEAHPKRFCVLCASHHNSTRKGYTYNVFSTTKTGRMP